MPDAGSRACFSLHRVAKTYRHRGGSEETYALSNLNLTIPWNASVAVLGTSGSGKSTLLKVLGMLDEPDEGDYSIVYHSPYGAIKRTGKQVSSAQPTDAEDVQFGRPAPGPIQEAPQPLTQRRKSDILRREFGFIFQFHHLLSPLACRENVALGLLLNGVPRRKALQTAEARMNDLGLGGLERKRPSRLSGGQAQRVAALRALIHQPHVIFADEPTGSLDRNNAHRVMRALTDWRESGTSESPRTLLLATHDLQQARDACDWFLFLDDGKVHGDGLVPADDVEGKSLAEYFDSAEDRRQ